MSRAELGEYINLDQNRVQQYESGKRKPKIPLLKRIADVLGVETMALMDPNIDTYVGAMHTLFQMEEKLDLRVTMKEGCYCLQFGDGRFGGMNNYLEKWYEVRKELEESMPSMTDEEREKKIFDYNMFEWTYPNAITVNTDKKYNEHPINRMSELKDK